MNTRLAANLEYKAWPLYFYMYAFGMDNVGSSTILDIRLGLCASRRNALFI